MLHLVTWTVKSKVFPTVASLKILIKIEIHYQAKQYTYITIHTERES